ncbi:MAG TPA: VIT1/CCC1 transporter family protein, partial [Thermoplasmata archaeon]|nr:VIT1/CCC1 transporter family protein [Thermoplasmata archaeon]
RHMGNPREPHPRATLLSDFILGSQDGLVNVLGILLGLVVSTHDVRIILIASLAALAAESISMSAVAYTSTRARRELFRSEVARELQEMREVPEMEREEVRVILRKWDYAGADLERMVREVEGKPKMMLDLMMAFELFLAPVAEDQPRKSAEVVLAATVIGSIIPLVPFFLFPGALATAAILAIILSAITLFLVGWYEARTTDGVTWQSGLRMVLIGLGAGFGGFLIGFVASHV